MSIRLRSGLQSAKVVEIGRFCFCSQVALSPQSGVSSDLRAKGKKEKARGRKKRNAPRNEQPFLRELKGKPSLRGEADTEQNKVKKNRTLARPPIGGPSERRGGSATFAEGNKYFLMGGRGVKLVCSEKSLSGKNNQGEPRAKRAVS